MRVDFETNVDCCKRWMSGISGGSLSEINPMVGDVIRVYDSRKLETEKNLKYTMTLVIWSHDTKDIKELQPAVKVV